MLDTLKKWFSKTEKPATIPANLEVLRQNTPEWEMLTAAVERDGDKPFQKEWDRTVALKTQLIERFGSDGVKLLYGRKATGDLLALGEWTDDCPWALLNHHEVGEAIREIFAPLSTQLPRTLDSLVANCAHLVAEHHETGWRLHYAVRGTLHTGANYFWHYIGGSPAPDPEPHPSLAKYGWKLPPEIRALYAIHNGFGCKDGIGVNPSDRVAVMAEMMNPIVEDVGNAPEDYRFEDLLDFSPDGMGNSQCFVREAEQVTGTADWDHESWELSNHLPFFEFVDQHLSRVHEE